VIRANLDDRSLNCGHAIGVVEVATDSATLGWDLMSLAFQVKSEVHTRM
jgi:hypothetical protein